MMAYAEGLKPEGHIYPFGKVWVAESERIIEPYEQTLKAMKAGERRAWAQRVIEKLRKHNDIDNDHFVFLAGADYRQNLIPHLKR